MLSLHATSLPAFQPLARWTRDKSGLNLTERGGLS